MPFRHNMQTMDLLTACRVFVLVGERGSFTLGAAAARVPQSVASRRVAALERHFGERLFDRSTRRAALTAFGREMLPSAKRLVELADTMEFNAEQAKLRPMALAVPETCSVRHLSELEAAARAEGTVLDFRAAGPAARAELLRDHDVRAALLAVPPSGADWRVPLGVATDSTGPTDPHGESDGDAGPLRLDTLRTSRARPSRRRLRIQPEDDVPHIRDRLEQLGHRAALVPAQITTAPSLTAAVSDVLRGDDFLLCPPAQARELGLHWRPLSGDPVARGYSVSSTNSEDAQRIRDRLTEHVARALGAGTDAKAYRRAGAADASAGAAGAGSEGRA